MNKMLNELIYVRKRMIDLGVGNRELNEQILAGLQRRFDSGRFPVNHRELQEAYVADDICPDCGGELDTGWECNDCKSDQGSLVVRGSME